MGINLQPPTLKDMKPRITVIGVGGAGGNAINNMISSGLPGVDFIAANTDIQALLTSSAEQRIQLGANLTEGQGAGTKPEIGEAAAEEALDEIRAQIAGSHMVFIACGMGGGTGTGAASVIARVAQEEGILTVGIVSKPFQFEGSRRMRIAAAGIEEMRKYVDTMIVIPNQNLFRIANEKTTFAEAFILADQVLYSGIACIVDLIVKEGLINLDFADVRVIMSGMGSAMMGTGEGEGERRAILAAEEAITNPLLDELTLKGARGLLISIVGDEDLTLYEVEEAASRVHQEVHPDANIIVGASHDDTLKGRVRVSIVASGMDQGDDIGRNAGESRAAAPPPLPEPSQHSPDPRSAGTPTAPSEPAAQKDASVAAGSIFDADRPSSGPGAIGVAAAPGSGFGVSPATTAQTAPPAPTPGQAPGPTAGQAPVPVPGQAPAPAAAPQSSALSSRMQALQSQPAEAQPSVPAHSGTSSAGAQTGQMQSAQAHPAASKGASWQAPGNVMIEEAAPQLIQSAKPEAQPVSATPAHQPPPLAPMPASQFVPAPPENIAAGVRKMPAVEDFPVVGQREYRAKSGGNTGSATLPTPGPVNQPPKKMGFFERLTGRRNHGGDASGQGSQPARPAAGYPQGATGQPQSGTSEPNHLTPNSTQSIAQDGERVGNKPELPMFFDQRKR